MAVSFRPVIDLCANFGWSLNSLQTENPSEILQRILLYAEQHHVAHVHVWARDWVDRIRENPSPADGELPAVIETLTQASVCPPVNQVAAADQRVLDVCWVDPGCWWLGWHIAGTIPQRWPGGIPSLKVPASLVSRAYLKTSEALLWSAIPIQPGDVCAEIGSAPGGSCQRLLELGVQVIAIDPAELDPIIAKHPQVSHLQMRGRDVRHRKLSEVSWLLVDSNVTPNHTLDTVEELVAGQHTHFRGLLLTLKMAQLELANQLDAHVQRVKSWGFGYVKTRQLAYGRQEVCLMALRQKSVRRFRSGRPAKPVAGEPK